MSKIFVYRGKPGLVLEVDGQHAKETLQSIREKGPDVSFGYIGTRDKETFVKLNPKLARYRFVKTVDEFIAEAK